MHLKKRRKPAFSNVRDRVVIAGDWHGDFPWGERVVERTAQAKTDVILHVGDFGIDPGSFAGQLFLTEVERACADYNVSIFVTPGNHEDWSVINYIPALESHAGFGEVKWLTNHIGVLPRGSRFQVFGADGLPKTFLSLGGAPSIDALHRTPGIDWWGAEQISWDDVAGVEADARALGPVDYMITHDAPEPLAPKIAAIVASNRNRKDDEIIAYCAQGRHRLTNAFNAARPSVLFHGHYHTRDTGEVVGGRHAYTHSGERLDLTGPDGHAADEFGCRIESLLLENTRGNAVILDVASGKVSPLAGC